MPQAVYLVFFPIAISQLIFFDNLLNNPVQVAKINEDSCWRYIIITLMLKEIRRGILMMLTFFFLLVLIKIRMVCFGPFQYI